MHAESRPPCMVTTISHVTLCVKDLDRSLKFYSDLVRLRLRHIREMEVTAVTRYVQEQRP